MRRHTAVLDEKGDAAMTEPGGALPELTRPLLEGPERRRSGARSPATRVRRLVTILERRQKSHPLLVGDVGVGKRAIRARFGEADRQR